MAEKLRDSLGSAAVQFNLRCPTAFDPEIVA